MRYTLLTLLLIVFALSAQIYSDAVMNIDITVPAPDEVIDQISEVRCYIETRPEGEVMRLYTGMPLAEAEALGGTLVQTGTYPGVINYTLPANGYQYNVGVFGLDESGNELVHTVGFDRYFLRCGVSGVGNLPLMQLVTDHDVYIQVNVTFQ